MFRLRTCEESVFANRSRPCLLFQIKRCSGSCVDRISREEYAADVQLATMFLLGKQQEVTQRLTDAMDEASGRLAFEQAAIFRDQIQSLRQVQEKQYISSSKGEDVDIVVAIQEAGQLCLNLAMVRGGRHLGDRPMFPTNAGDNTPADAIAAFMRQHYAVHPVPTRLIRKRLRCHWRINPCKTAVNWFVNRATGARPTRPWVSFRTGMQTWCNGRRNKLPPRPHRHQHRADYP